MRALLLRKGKEGSGQEGGKGRGRDLPDQCQTASYAHDSVDSSLTFDPVDAFYSQTWAASRTYDDRELVTLAGSYSR